MTRISRRTFVANTAALAGAGLLGQRRPLPPDSAPEIPRRPFGNTGVEVTMVGLGGGSRFFIPVPDSPVATS